MEPELKPVRFFQILNMCSKLSSSSMLTKMASCTTFVVMQRAKECGLCNEICSNTHAWGST